MNKLNHVAFIMDGNGRWGKKEVKEETWTFKRCRNCKKIVGASIKLKIPIITFTFFPLKIGKTKKRKKLYIQINKHLFYERNKNIIKQGIKINILGELNKFSSDIKLSLKNRQTYKKIKK